jgi:hypothetical protein
MAQPGQPSRGKGWTIALRYTRLWPANQDLNMNTVFETARRALNDPQLAYQPNRSLRQMLDLQNTIEATEYHVFEEAANHMRQRGQRCLARQADMIAHHKRKESCENYSQRFGKEINDGHKEAVKYAEARAKKGGPQDQLDNAGKIWDSQP